MVTTFRPDFSILPFLLVLCFTAIPSIVFMWWNVLRRRKAEPTCGKCGYVIVGQTTLRCSECGCDFREFGIQPSKLGKIKLKIFLAWWTSHLLIVAIPLTMFILPWIPKYTDITTQSSLIGPNSGQYKSVEFDIKSSEYVNKFLYPNKLVQSKNITITLNKNNSQTARLTVDMMAENNYNNTDGETIFTRSSISLDSLLKWMNNNQIDTSSQAVKTEAERILHKFIDLVDPKPSRNEQFIPLNLLLTDTFTNNGPYKQSVNYDLGLWGLLLPLPWPALWIAGIILFIKTMRKQHRQLDEAKSNWPAI